MPLLSARQLQRQQQDMATNKRHKNSSKPAFLVSPPHFYQCPCCHRLMIDVTASALSCELSCCGVPVLALVAQDAADHHIHHRLALTVFGGFDSNSLTVSLGDPAHPMEDDHHISWIYLYTFQGGQLKFLSPGDAPGATFALAEKDAYVYCDRAICKGRDCKFNCKRGFAVWAYCTQHGLWHNAF